MSHAAKGKIVSGDAAILARRYGGSLYELAEEQNQIDSVTADLRLLKNLVAESREFQTIANHPRLTRTQLVTAAKSIAASAKLGKLTGNFLALVAQNRRLDILGAVIESFLAELAARRGEHTAEVYAAFPLTPTQQEQISARLRQIAGGEVHLSLHEDKSLIGGFKARIGSRLIDASIKSRLDRLERHMKAGKAA